MIKRIIFFLAILFIISWGIYLISKGSFGNLISKIKWTWNTVVTIKDSVEDKLDDAKDSLDEVVAIVAPKVETITAGELIKWLPATPATPTVITTTTNDNYASNNWLSAADLEMLRRLSKNVD